MRLTSKNHYFLLKTKMSLRINSIPHPPKKRKIEPRQLMVAQTQQESVDYQPVPNDDPIEEGLQGYWPDDVIQSLTGGENVEITSLFNPDNAFNELQLINARSYINAETDREGAVPLLIADETSRIAPTSCKQFEAGDNIVLDNEIPEIISVKARGIINATNQGNSLAVLPQPSDPHDAPTQIKSITTDSSMTLTENNGLITLGTTGGGIGLSPLPNYVIAGLRDGKATLGYSNDLFKFTTSYGTEDPTPFFNLIWTPKWGYVVVKREETLGTIYNSTNGINWNIFRTFPAIQLQGDVISSALYKEKLFVTDALRIYYWDEATTGFIEFSALGISLINQVLVKDNYLIAVGSNRASWFDLDTEPSTATQFLSTGTSRGGFFYGDVLYLFGTYGVYGYPIWPPSAATRIVYDLGGTPTITGMCGNGSNIYAVGLDEFFYTLAPGNNSFNRRTIGWPTTNKDIVYGSNQFAVIAKQTPSRPETTLYLYVSNNARDFYSHANAFSVGAQPPGAFILSPQNEIISQPIDIKGVNGIVVNRVGNSFEIGLDSVVLNRIKTTALNVLNSIPSITPKVDITYIAHTTSYSIDVESGPTDVTILLPNQTVIYYTTSLTTDPMFRVYTNLTATNRTVGPEYDRRIIWNHDRGGNSTWFHFQNRNQETFITFFEGNEPSPWSTNTEDLVIIFGKSFYTLNAPWQPIAPTPEPSGTVIEQIDTIVQDQQSKFTPPLEIDSVWIGSTEVLLSSFTFAPSAINTINVPPNYSFVYGNPNNSVSLGVIVNYTSSTMVKGVSAGYYYKVFNGTGYASFGKVGLSTDPTKVCFKIRKYRLNLESRIDLVYNAKYLTNKWI